MNARRKSCCARSSDRSASSWSAGPARVHLRGFQRCASSIIQAKALRWNPETDISWAKLDGSSLPASLREASAADVEPARMGHLRRARGKHGTAGATVPGVGCQPE